MLHDFVRDVQTEFHGKEGRVRSRGEPPELEEIRDAADVSSRSIGRFVDHSVDVSRERFDKTSLGRFACDFDRAKPKSDDTTETSFDFGSNKRQGRTYCRV